MKIAVIHWGFPPIIGGVETHLAILCPELVKRGHSVFLLTGNVEGKKAEDKWKGIKITRSPLLNLNWLSRRGLEDLEDAVNNVLKNFLYKAQPDLIYAHNMHYFSSLHAVALEKLARKLGVPLILHVHNVWDDGLFLDLTLRIKWDHMIAISHFIKKELLGIGVNPKKITVIHHGIDRERFEKKFPLKKILKKFPQLKGKQIIFHPARMGLAKGSDVVVKAFRLVKKECPQAFLVLAGSSNIIDWVNTQQKDTAYILHLIHQFALSESVLIDTFSIEEMGGLYQHSNLCVYPSAFGEPFGLAMLEAMAAGKPIIVTDSGGMPEIIKDGQNGFIIRVRDWETLSKRCLMLLKNKDLCQKMGEEGKKMVKEVYNKEKMTTEIETVFNKFKT